MKKVISATAVALAIFMAVTVQAGDHHHMKKSWLDKEIADINEDYDEAIAKINHSSLTEEQKTTLRAQAQANKDLATSQAEVVNAQIQKNMEARQNIINSFHHEEHHKKLHKIFKEIDDIL